MELLDAMESVCPKLIKLPVKKINNNKSSFFIVLYYNTNIAFNMKVAESYGAFIYKCKFNLLKRFRNSWIKRGGYAYVLGGYPLHCKFGVGFLWGGDSSLTYINLMLYLYCLVVYLKNLVILIQHHVLIYRSYHLGKAICS